MKLTKRVLFIACLITILYLSQISSAAHYIVGQVNDALDSTSANGRIITLWNPANGLSDNITDIIGQAGNSGTDNVYFVDCEALNTPCQIGDTINAKIFNNGDNYASNYTSIIITDAGYDLASTIKLNSPPSSNLTSPANYANLSNNIILNCSASDLDSDLTNITLYGNWSNGWHKNETKQINGSLGQASFNISIPEGRYIWNCLVEDSIEIENYASINKTINIDLTSPIIYSLEKNLSGNICGTSNNIRITCNTSDSFTGIKEVLINSHKPSGQNQSHIAQNIPSTNSYFADILLDEIGNWNFECKTHDYSNNTNIQNINTLVKNESADLTLNSQNITFPENIIESDPIIIYAEISNIGCSAANNFLIGFFLGLKESGMQIGLNQTGTILEFSNKSFNITWTPLVGDNTLNVYVDLSDLLSESNETNNQANKTIQVQSWQQFYGNLSVEKRLADFSNSSISLWKNHTSYSGNIFVTDSDGTINWLSLQALGRNLTNNLTNNDFSELDSLLGTSSFDDSINYVYTSDTNIPLQTDNFVVFDKLIENTPISKSTNNSNFHTGILWDTSLDSNGEFDTINKEEIIFITKINRSTTGKYGIYDYEIKIPVKLREYRNFETTKINFYYDLN